MEKRERAKVSYRIKPSLLIPVVLLFLGIGCEVFFRQGLEKAIGEYEMGTWMLICDALRHPLLFSTIPFLLTLLAAMYSDIQNISKKGWYKWCLGISTAYLVLAPALRLVAYLSPGTFVGSAVSLGIHSFITKTPYLFIIPGILWGFNKSIFVKEKVS